MYGKLKLFIILSLATLNMAQAREIDFKEFEKVFKQSNSKDIELAHNSVWSCQVQSKSKVSNESDRYYSTLTAFRVEKRGIRSHYLFPSILRQCKTFEKCISLVDSQDRLRDVDGSMITARELENGQIILKNINKNQASRFMRFDKTDQVLGVMTFGLYYLVRMNYQMSKDVLFPLNETVMTETYMICNPEY